MENFKQYFKVLLKGIVPFIFLLALVNLVDIKSFQYLLNYFLISNYLTFLPYNMSYEELERQSVERKEKSDQNFRRSKRNFSDVNRRPKELLTFLGIYFLKYIGLIIGAPLIFIYRYLWDN